MMGLEGKYHPLLFAVLQTIKAKSAIIIVFDGPEGFGAAAALGDEFVDMAPGVLRAMADQLEGDIKAYEKKGLS